MPIPVSVASAAQRCAAAAILGLVALGCDAPVAPGRVTASSAAPTSVRTAGLPGARAYSGGTMATHATKVGDPNGTAWAGAAASAGDRVGRVADFVQTVFRGPALPAPVACQLHVPPGGPLATGQYQGACTQDVDKYPVVGGRAFNGRLTIPDGAPMKTEASANGKVDAGLDGAGNLALSFFASARVTRKAGEPMAPGGFGVGVGRDPLHFTVSEGDGIDFQLRVALQDVEVGMDLEAERGGAQLHARGTLWRGDPGSGEQVTGWSWTHAVSTPGEHVEAEEIVLLDATLHLEPGEYALEQDITSGAVLEGDSSSVSSRAPFTARDRASRQRVSGGSARPSGRS